MRVWHAGRWWTVTGKYYWNHCTLRADDGTEISVPDDECHTTDAEGRDEPREAFQKSYQACTSDEGWTKIT